MSNLLDACCRFVRHQGEDKHVAFERSICSDVEENFAFHLLLIDQDLISIRNDLHTDFQIDCYCLVKFHMVKMMKTSDPKMEMVQHLRNHLNGNFDHWYLISRIVLEV